MIRTLVLISLFVTCAFGIGEFCVEDHHCAPGEKCSIASNASVPMKQCVNSEQDPTFCESTSDCDWYLGYVCRNGFCGFILK